MKWDRQKGQVLYDSTLMRHLELSNTETESRKVVAGCFEEDEMLVIIQWARNFFWGRWKRKKKMSLLFLAVHSQLGKMAKLRLCNFFYTYLFHMYLCKCHGMSVKVRGQLVGSWFSPSFVWNLENKLQLSGMAAGNRICWAIFLAPGCVFYHRKNLVLLGVHF